MVLYKKECCPSVVLALRCLNDFLCPPRVLSSPGVKRSLTGTAENNCDSVLVAGYAWSTSYKPDQHVKSRCLFGQSE